MILWRRVTPLNQELGRSWECGSFICLTAPTTVLFCSSKKAKAMIPTCRWRGLQWRSLSRDFEISLCVFRYDSPTPSSECTISAAFRMVKKFELERRGLQPVAASAFTSLMLP